MARLADSEMVRAGVYAAVHRYEEAEFGRWKSLWAAHGRRYDRSQPYPRQRILDGLRAGQVVNVPVHSLPAEARRGEDGFGRAIVGPDDTIEFADENAASLWLEENGL